MPITQIVPLTINISSTNLGLDATTETGSKPVLKAVSFDVPPSGDEDERRSICQSPSWEAYGRRKKTEKKDVKKEQKKEQLKREQQKKEEERKEQERKEQLKKEQLKKEQLKKEQLKKEQLKKEQLEKEQRKKEQQVKATKREKEESMLRNALIKKKRLSKQPPPSSPHAIDQANRMTSAAALAASRDRQRPSSALEFTTPSGDDMPSRPHHGRSGSFTSLIRSPFESRRASLETSRPSETGFIGGIKLEIQRHAAYQKTVEGPEKMDESKIHPALRTNNAHNQKWSAPPARPNPESQRRAYPPITRHPAAAAKTRSLISSAEMDASDAGTMDRWRAFVGLKPKDSGESSKAATQQQASKQSVMTSDATTSASALPPPQTNAKEKPAVVAASQTSRGPDISQPNLPNGSGKPLDQSSKPKLTVSTAILPSNSPVPAPRPQPREKTARPTLVSSPDAIFATSPTSSKLKEKLTSELEFSIICVFTTLAGT
ncbi:reticulocyte-binding protein 2 homolog a [Trichoderma asperellum]|uniref:Reticulocyte-binding protein 2 homolog a n=1 Tax=Trichoderma asperellum TaxID=101201 RepID=A0A6V8QXS0_TRIAP|nr:reticulocyte-binding protein 2 homolog a [Trichoderma asperellum]